MQHLSCIMNIVFRSVKSYVFRKHNSWTNQVIMLCERWLIHLKVPGQRFSSAVLVGLLAFINAARQMSSVTKVNAVNVLISCFDVCRLSNIIFCVRLCEVSSVPWHCHSYFNSFSSLFEYAFLSLVLLSFMLRFVCVSTIFDVLWHQAIFFNSCREVELVSTIPRGGWNCDERRCAPLNNHMYTQKGIPICKF